MFRADKLNKIKLNEKLDEWVIIFFIGFKILHSPQMVS